MDYEAILIPTDGSKASQKAVPHGLDLAAKHGASVHVLFVVDTDGVDLFLGKRQLEGLKEGRFGELGEVKEKARRALRQVVEKAEAQGLEVEKAILAGSPPERIVNYASRKGCDVIVMASHGSAGFRRVILGSVTEKVLRKATIPVMVINHKIAD